MKFLQTLFLSLICVGGTTFLFSSCNSSLAKPKEETWNNSDSTTFGEIYHYNDSIDSLVANYYFDKSRKAKKKIEISKRTNNKEVYWYSLKFTADGKKSEESFGYSENSNTMEITYDKFENILHKRIGFFSNQYGSASFHMDYEDNKMTTLFLGALGYYQNQEYDAYGRIKNVMKPVREEGATADSTHMILFNTDEEKFEFKDTLLDQEKKLETELLPPVHLK